jgi:hypothetical protein
LLGGASSVASLGFNATPYAVRKTLVFFRPVRLGCTLPFVYLCHWG